MPKLEPTIKIIDDGHGSIAHLAYVAGVTGRVFHVNVSSDAMSAWIVELNETIRGRNRQELLERARVWIQKFYQPDHPRRRQDMRQLTTADSSAKTPDSSPLPVAT